MRLKLTKTEADRLNNEGIANIKILEPNNPRAQEFTDRMISHSKLVAEAAERIASLISDMDAEKAYIYGILHDYGKYFGDVENKNTFHGLVGYEKLIEMGYPDIAKINLTHTFVSKEFTIEEYSAYNQKDMIKTKELVDALEFDDYDKLLQLCDLLPKKFDRCEVEGYEGIEKRFERIERVYNIPQKTARKKVQEAIGLKEYFEQKCGCNIYELLGIKND